MKAAMYQIAIALNNTAVALMERRRYSQASEALQVAIDVMKQIFRPPSTTETKGSLEDYKTQLIKASKELARPINHTHAYNTSHTKFKCEPADLFVLSSQAEPELLARSVVFSKSVNFAIRIDADTSFLSDDDILDGGVNLDLDSAIIIYNYGLSCQLRLDSIEDSNLKQDLFENSFKLFQMSCQVITPELESIFLDRCDTDDMDVDSRLLLTSMLTYRSLWILSCSSNATHDVRCCYYLETNHFRNLYIKLQSLNNVSDSSRSVSACAPVA